MFTLQRRALHFALALALAGCAAPLNGHGSFSVDRTPTTLLQPAAFDWTFHTVGGRQITNGRDTFIKRQVQAFPTATNWAAGLDLVNDLGCPAGDTVPNGMASVFSTKTSPVSLKNKVFLLTKSGRFLRVDRTGATGYASLTLGKTFTRTYVTLSPSAVRAYVVSDDGTFFVIDTQRMIVLATKSLGANALGCAPVFDPYHAHDGGGGEPIYIPDNNGFVTKYQWTNGVISGPTVYDVASTVVPASTATNKIEAPAVVLDGKIYVGDQAGGLHVFNTATNADDAIFFTGSPINTPPAIEIQDGTYSLTDSSGLPVSVARGTPIYAFVTSGANCFWLDMYSLKSYKSRSLYIDDYTPATTYGYLASYNYEPVPTTGTDLTLTDWCAIRTDSTGQLSGATAGSNKTKDYIAAGEIYADGATKASGPVACYLRFSTSGAGTAIVREAYLTLTVEKAYTTKLPEFRPAPSFLQGTTTVWTYGALTNANRPAWDPDNVGIYLSGAANAAGNIKLNPGSQCQWEISDAFKGSAASDYTVVMLYDQDDRVIWEGTKSIQPDNGTNANLVYGPQFRSPSDGNPDHRPIFTVKTTTGSFPSATIETPAVIDAFHKRAYVFYSNTLYSIDFSSPTAWVDADAATPKTIFNTARLGRQANGGGATYASRGRFVSNLTAPVFSYDLGYAYVLDRYPTDATQTSPTTWNYGLSKIQLPLSATTDKLTGTSPTPITGVTGAASNYMIVDPFTNPATTGGNVFLGLGDGKVYQYDH